MGSHSPDLEEEESDRIGKVYEDIKQELFEPDPEESKCQRCDYRKPNPAVRFAGCPVWRDETLSQEEKAGSSLEKEDIVSKIDAYGSLKATVKSIESQIEVLREEIENYFKEKSLKKFSGKRYQLSCDFRSKWDFSKHEAELYHYLQEKGLFERIKKPSPALVQKLLEDRKIDRSIRANIESLGRKEDIATIRYKPLGDEGDED